MGEGLTMERLLETCGELLDEMLPGLFTEELRRRERVAALVADATRLGEFYPDWANEASPNV